MVIILVPTCCDSKKLIFNSIPGGKLVINQQHELNPWQKWQILDGQLINLSFPDKALSIAAEEGTLKNLIVQDKDYSLMRQKWRVEYV